MYFLLTWIEPKSISKVFISVSFDFFFRIFYKWEGGPAPSKQRLNIRMEMRKGIRLRILGGDLPLIDYKLYIGISDSLLKSGIDTLEEVFHGHDKALMIRE